MSPQLELPSPARSLEGLDLDGNWRVIGLIERASDSTGGFFSQQYRIESAGGKKAFLKALDITRALEDSPDPARILESLTTAFNYERDLLASCKQRKLTRVVTILEDGKVRVRSGVDGVVQYLIFEEADCDIRQYMETGDRFDNVLRLRTLHHIATGINQLHTIEIAHQDLKPSNVLVFKDGSKIGDLGCASRKGSKNPREDLEVIGDYQYAPPELLYHAVPIEWNCRRFACDLYLLGSMIVYLFAGAALTPLWVLELPENLRPSQWTGTFGSILPFVREAFDKAVERFKCYIPDQKLADELEYIVRQLCDPEPMQRGHPRNRTKSTVAQYSLERYVAQFDLLAKRASWKA